MTDTPEETEGTADEAIEVDDAATEAPEDVQPEAAEQAASGEAGEVDEVTELKQALAERTADLQRTQAEFVNYKRRVDRDRELVKQNATFAALTPIIEVLDTIDRAREHGPLEGGFKAVAEQLERIVSGLGLVKFGEVGDPFDPSMHEALSHIGEDPEVEVTTCKVVAKSGYRIGDRVVRAAQVLVVDPPAAAPAEEPAQPADTSDAEPADAAEQAEETWTDRAGRE